MKTISSLHKLVCKIDKSPYRSLEYIKRYNGEDWKQYVRFQFDKGCEIGLSYRTPFFLVGLMAKQRYYIKCPSTIKILEQQYYPEWSFYNQNLNYLAFDISGSSYIVGKDYTAFLIVKHFIL